MDLCEAKILARREVEQWLGDAWQISYFRAARLYGQCRQSARGNFIRLNERFLAQCGYEEVLDLIRHEIAHGLAGGRCGHGPKFAKICNLVGANPRSQMKVSLDVPYKFKLTCLGCGKIYHKHAYKRRWRCGGCRGKLRVERTAEQSTI